MVQDLLKLMGSRSQLSCLCLQQRWNWCWSCKQGSSTAVNTHYISSMSQCNTSEEEKSGLERINHVICFSASARGFSFNESNFKTLEEQRSQCFSWECQMLSIYWKALLAIHPPFSLLAVPLGQPKFLYCYYPSLTFCHLSIWQSCIYSSCFLRKCL